MAIGTQRNTLLTMFKNEVGQSTNSNYGGNTDAQIVHMLQRTQQALHDDYDWPFRYGYEDVTVGSGTQTRTTSTIDLYRVDEAWVKYSGTWRRLEYGITEDHYNAVDSDDSENQDPIRAWRVDTSASNTFEVWPIPQTSQTVRLRGALAISDNLSNGTSTAVLDDFLIVLYTAAEWMRARGQDGADEKLAKAQNRLNTLRGHHQHKTVFVLGGGMDPNEGRYVRPRPTWGKRLT